MRKRLLALAVALPAMIGIGAPPAHAVGVFVCHAGILGGNSKWTFDGAGAWSNDISGRSCIPSTSGIPADPLPFGGTYGTIGGECTLMVLSRGGSVYGVFVGGTVGVSLATDDGTAGFLAIASVHVLTSNNAFCSGNAILAQVVVTPT